MVGSRARPPARREGPAPILHTLCVVSWKRTGVHGDGVHFAMEMERWTVARHHSTGATNADIQSLDGPRTSLGPHFEPPTGADAIPNSGIFVRSRPSRKQETGNRKQETGEVSVLMGHRFSLYQFAGFLLSLFLGSFFFFFFVNRLSSSFTPLFSFYWFLFFLLSRMLLYSHFRFAASLSTT